MWLDCSCRAGWVLGDGGAVICGVGLPAAGHRPRWPTGQRGFWLRSRRLQERGPRHWRGDRPAGLGVGVADTCAPWVLPHRVPAERRAPADEVGHGPDEHCVIAAAGGRVRGLAGVDLRPGPVGVGPVIDIDADLVDIAVAGIAALGAPGGQVADPEGRLQQNWNAAPGSPRSTVTTWRYPAM